MAAVRGIAAALAASAVWLAISGRVPALRLPKPAMPSPWVWPSAFAAGVVAGLLSLGLLGVPLASLVIGTFAAAIPFAVDAGRRVRVREAVAEAWPDFLALMKGRIAAGATLPDAFIAAARSARVSPLPATLQRCRTGRDWPACRHHTIATARV